MTLNPEVVYIKPSCGLSWVLSFCILIRFVYYTEESGSGPDSRNPLTFTYSTRDRESILWEVLILPPSPRFISWHQRDLTPRSLPDDFDDLKRSVSCPFLLDVPTDPLPLFLDGPSKDVQKRVLIPTTRVPIWDTPDCLPPETSRLSTFLCGLSRVTTLVSTRLNRSHNSRPSRGDCQMTLDSFRFLIFIPDRGTWFLFSLYVSVIVFIYLFSFRLVFLTKYSTDGVVVYGG